MGNETNAVWEPTAQRDDNFGEHLARLKKLAQWPSMLDTEADRTALRGVLDEFYFVLTQQDQRDRDFEALFATKEQF